MRIITGAAATALLLAGASQAKADLANAFITGTTYPTLSVPSGVTPLTLTAPGGAPLPYDGATPLTPAPGLSIDVSGSSPSGNGLVNGNGPNTTPYTYYVAPYENATTQYTGNYLVPGYDTGKITYNFTPGTYDSFGFLWGSVDTFNSLTLTVSNGIDTETLNTVGSDLPSSGGAIGPDNSYYVIYNAAPGYYFTTIVADDTAASTRTDLYTFEQVPLFVSTTPVNPVPEPAAMAVLGVGLIGLGLARRRKR